jgi:hypothetical protein
MSMRVYWLRQRGQRGVEMAEIVCIGGQSRCDWLVVMSVGEI